MADDRKRQRDFARPKSALGIPEVFADDDKTPLPVTAEEAIGWQHIDRRMVAVEAAIRGITPDVTRHEQAIGQWSKAAQECLVEIGAASQRLENIESNLDRDWKRFSDSLDSMNKTLADIGTRITKLEVAVESVGKQQTEQAAKLAVLADRVDRIERAGRDEAVAEKAVTRERRRWLSLANAAYVVIAAVAAGITYLWQRK